MFLSCRDELFVLLATFVGGVAIGFIFDLFRIYRQNFSFGSSLVWLQDIVMWMIVFVVVCATIFVSNSGKIRWYEFLGFFCGTAVYMALLSRWVRAGTGILIGFLKKIFSVAFHWLSFPFRLAVKPLTYVCKRVKKRFSSFKKAEKRKKFHFSRIFKKI